MVCPAIPAQITSYDEPEIAPSKLSTGTGAGGGARFLSFLPFLPFRQGALACAAASGASDPMANSCAAPYMAAAR